MPVAYCYSFVRLASRPDVYDNVKLHSAAMQIEKQMENPNYRSVNKVGSADKEAVLDMAEQLHAEFQKCVDSGSELESWAVRLVEFEEGRRRQAPPPIPLYDIN